MSLRIYCSSNISDYCVCWSEKWPISFFWVRWLSSYRENSFLFLRNLIASLHQMKSFDLSRLFTASIFLSAIWNFQLHHQYRYIYFWSVWETAVSQSYVSLSKGYQQEKSDAPNWTFAAEANIWRGGERNQRNYSTIFENTFAIQWEWARCNLHFSFRFEVSRRVWKGHKRKLRAETNGQLFFFRR